MMTWCSSNANAYDIMPLIPMWHEWNVNTNDVMMMWFALYVNLVMSCLACEMCMSMHGVCALFKTSTSKSLSGLACAQAFLGTKYPKCKLEHAKHDSHCIS